MVYRINVEATVHIVFTKFGLHLENLDMKFDQYKMRVNNMTVRI